MSSRAARLPTSRRCAVTSFLRMFWLSRSSGLKVMSPVCLISSRAARNSFTCAPSFSKYSPRSESILERLFLNSASFSRDTARLAVRSSDLRFSRTSVSPFGERRYSRPGAR